MSSILESNKRKVFNFKGPICAPVTPFDNDGELNLSMIPKYVQHLVKIGVKGLYISGTTGEVFNLTLDEKLALIEAFKKALDQLPESQKLLTMVLVSSTVVRDVIKLAKRVEELGFDCIALLPPIYYTATTKNELVTYVKQIAQQGAPNTPILYYHSPLKTGELKFEFEGFIQSSIEQIPQFIAVKFSDPNLVRYESVQSKFGDKVRIFAGMNEILLPSKAYGVESAICSSFSFGDCVGAYISILDAVDRNDLAQARKDQKLVADKCARLRKVNYFAAIKAELNEELAADGLFFGKPRSPVLIE